MGGLDGRSNEKSTFLLQMHDLHAYHNHLGYDPQHIASLGSSQSMERSLDLLSLLAVQPLQQVH